MKTLALGAALSLIVQAGTSAAATTHYWRFETSPGFLVDSVGAAPTTAFGSPVQASLPGSGRGASFAVIGGNASALDVEAGDRLTTPSFPVNDFTVEVLAHPDALPGSFGNTLAAVADSQNNVEAAWLLQVRASQLALLLCQATNCEVTFSGLSVVGPGKDYFFAAAVDLDGGQTTFYLQDLTDAGPLETTTISHSTTSLNTPVNFAIGATGNGQLPFDGLIDEVRISDHVRVPSELLINEPMKVPMKVPSLGVTGLALLISTMCLAGWYTRVARRSTLPQA